MQQPDPFVVDSLERADYERNARRYFRAASILGEARSKQDSAHLRAAEAEALGSGVEYRMIVAEALGVTPPADMLDDLLGRLDFAISVHDTSAGLHWTKAAICARMTGDFPAAEKALQRAMVLGAAHPGTAQLQTLIREAKAPPQPDTSPTAMLLTLLLRLIDKSADGWLGALEGPAPDGDLPESFDQHVAMAGKLARDGADTGHLLSRFRQIRSDGWITADALDYGLEFVFRATEAGDHPKAAQAALAELARFLRDSSFNSSNGQPTRSDLRKAGRVARNGLDIVAATQVPLDPDLHADLWIALGQATSRGAGLDMARSFDSYTRALHLKRDAANAADEARLIDLLKRMLDHAVRMGIGADMGLSALGEARSALEAAFAAARAIGDQDLIHYIGTRYNTLLSAISQPGIALQVLDELLAVATGGQRVDLLLERAMRLSEVRDKRAALVLHEELEPQIDVLSQDRRCSYWNSYSNTLRDIHLFERALAAIDTAIALKPDPGAYVDQLGPMLHTNRGRILLELGRADEAEGEVDKALELLGVMAVAGDEKIRMAGLRTQIALQKGDFATAHDICMGAIDHLFDRLTRGGADPVVCMSMLQEWSRFDGLGLVAKIRSDRPAAEVLSFAEAAKGRLMRLLTRGGGDAERDLLTAGGMMPAVQAARDWVRARAGRQVLSFFCSSNGLALFSVQGDKAHVTFRWLQGAAYDEFRDQLYTPWETITDWSLDRGIQQALAARNAPPELLLGAAESMSAMMLDKLGGLMAELAPHLGQGGSQLVIVPHRVLRSMPLGHARLPDGRYVSEIFHEVSILPSMADFLHMPREAAERQDPARISALLDPRGDLPFARLEAAPVADTRVAVGDEAHKRAFLDAMARDRCVLVSAHGAFVPDNPWASTIEFADGPLALSELVSARGLEARLMILSCCEAGLSQSSNSDEPFGFPSILQAAGIPHVVAPAWRVDDLATCLLVSRSLRELRTGMPPARAVSRASHWLRDLSAHETLACLSDLKQQGAGAAATAALAEQEQWLSNSFAGPEKPFNAPLYWAGFQHFGLPDTFSEANGVD